MTTRAIAEPDDGSASALELARRIHHTVAQRLAGIAYLLAADRESPDEALDRCRSEVEAALGELHEALSSVRVPTAGAGGTDVGAELRALLDAFPAVDLRWRWHDPGDIGPDELVERFLVEALRNVRKHAEPKQVHVDLNEAPGVTVVEVVNDGTINRRTPSCRAGRQLLEVEASLYGAVVQSAPKDTDRWSQRLILPAAEQGTVAFADPVADLAFA